MEINLRNLIEEIFYDAVQQQAAPTCPDKAFKSEQHRFVASVREVLQLSPTGHLYVTVIADPQPERTDGHRARVVAGVHRVEEQAKDDLLTFCMERGHSGSPKLDASFIGIRNCWITKFHGSAGLHTVHIWEDPVAHDLTMLWTRLNRSLVREPLAVAV